MKMKIIDRAEKKAVSARNGTKTIRKLPVLLLLLLLPVTFGLSGCEDEYYAGARPGYGPYYGGGYGPGYGPGYPGYGPYPGAVTVEIGDRPIIIAALVIMWAGAITSGGRDIGSGATVKESGSTATTL